VQRFWGRCLLGLALAMGGTGAVGASAAPRPASCIEIERIMAFAPRGEVYVEIRTACEVDDFAEEDSIVAYLELHTVSPSATGEDIRVYPDEPRSRRTLSFQNLDLASGDPLLVRLVHFGEIIGLETTKVP
jgi:hypothetical protein